MAKLELYRAKCSFSVDAPARTTASSQSETKSVPTSPNFLRASNINTLNLNNKVNQNIQFFTKLSAKTIDEGTNPTVTPGSPKVASRKKDKSPVRLLDKENDQQAKDKEDDNKEQEEQELPNQVQQQQQQRTSKSSEDLTSVSDDVNEKDIKDQREIFLSFKEGDLFRVLSKEWELWWAVRSLDSNRRVGLVQAQLLEKTDDEVLDDEDSENMVSE
ncbi:hypothetical protein ONE63_002582 [Megalurothrips usitatus]|uniref:SH3 domain-containing protein n=1 Tax=Megalurothrips usitatus TaxID=439358 RepID=A0AAV7X8K4_9NEOP|nr:hypothetical protein ONE63_002582 [Megalurothrips usitatus]